MLLIKQTIKIACPEGMNLAEQTQVGKRKIETMQGPQWDPIFECKAVGGTPFAILDTVRAPIALKTGDEISVDAATGYVVTVEREGAVVYPPAAVPSAAQAKGKGGA
jgi:hypothetical protein